MVFCVAGIRHVHRVTHRCLAAAVCVDLPVAGDGHIPDLFVRLALGVEPALDDLDAVEVRAVDVPQRADQESRRLALRAQL